MNKKDNVKEVPHSFDHHILLYAKNWYKKTNHGIIEDLKTLLSEYAGIDASISDVQECLCNCFSQYAPKCGQGIALQEILKWGWRGNINHRTPEEIMIGLLSISDGKYVDPSQLLNALRKDSKTP